MEDQEGSELPDIHVARQEAIHNARDLMSAAVRDGFDISHRVYEICDENGDIILRLPFCSVISRQE